MRWARSREIQMVVVNWINDWMLHFSLFDFWMHLTRMLDLMQ